MATKPINRTTSHHDVMSETMKINLNIEKALGQAFRDYVYKKYGTTYKSGAELERAIRMLLEAEGVLTAEGL
jgi:hypothetical protein